MSVPYRLAAATLWLLAGVARAEVLINEIMYHPASEKPAEEFIELYNSGGGAVDISGWKFTSGVNFTLPPGSLIPAGGYLVVAANTAAFQAKYPGVTNFVAGWTGILSNSGNKITLEDVAGLPMDEVAYTDDGDWAVRIRDVDDDGRRGWTWQSDADGLGKSLELVNSLFLNQYGENWAASTTAQGTPGRVNSLAASNIAPLILDVAHFPLVPKSTETVNVTAMAVDDATGAITMRVHYRLDGPATFAVATMVDDGAHGDGGPGDAVFGATLPAQANDAIVEFYIEAVDATNRTRFWPAPQKDDAATVQTQNCLYQVDNVTYAGAQPYYKMVMRDVDRTELADINGGIGAFSNARFNTTWITRDGTSMELRYLTGVRNRGHGSATRQPQSFNVSFRNDDKWKGITALNLNTQSTHSQYFGSTLFRAAGLPAPESRPVQIRVNNVNPTTGIATTNGFYVANEVQDSDFADHHFPLDSSGDVYRVKRTDGAPPPNTLADGNLEYAPPAAGQAPPDPYRSVYFKHTNVSEDNWNDLINLTLAISKGHSAADFSTTYDAGYEAAVRAAADVDEWMRFLATETLVDNSETNISNGYGDDYYLYFGVIDPRAELIPFDLDTICGQGDNVPTPTQHGLFRMVNKDNSAANGPTPLNSFIKFPAFAPLYYGALHDLIEGPFSQAAFDSLVDNTLNGVVSQTRINSIKAFQDTRTAYLASLIPLNISVTSGPAVQNGYPHTTTATVSLGGDANAIDTRSVRVNGVAAIWTAWTATWSAPNVALTPGINKVIIQSFDSSGNELERSTYDVWYDDGSVTAVSANIASNTTWTPAGGPYQVTTNVTVNSGATLTIQPGTSVYLASAASLIVANGGRILAEGTETRPIRFTRLPGATTSWGNLQLNGAVGSPETRIAYAHFEFNGGSPCILCTDATVYLDHLTFGNPAISYIHLDSSSFIISNCVFPTATAGFELVHGTGGVKSGGYGIIRDCFFGNAQGYNDIVDFTGGSRPSQALIQFFNNVFTGATDDILDLDGTDSWVEGNIFLHCHKNGSPDTASAVSGGQDQGNANAKSEVTIIGNIFFDCDNVTTAKEGNFYTLINNTIVHQNRTGGTETRAGVLNLADDGIPQGAGTYVEGNIIYDAEALERSYTPPLTSIVTFNNNILPFAWTGAGSGNTVVDPRFKYVPTVAETNFATFAEAQIIRDWFSLLPGSPAIGTGPNGRDKGGVIPLGASISGEPNGTTNQTTATLAVGSNASGFGIPSGPWPNGSGFTHYQWMLDNGAFSAETPIGTPISLTGLSNGPHNVSVIGKNDIGLYQNDGKLGADATVTVSKTWTVDPLYVPPAPTPLVQINEVLVKNLETQGFNGVFPDIIELHNAGNAAADISGWGLTDNASIPLKYEIPSGTILAPGAYLVIYASNSSSVPAPKTGFGLKEGGDTLTLNKSAAAGGGVADVLAFGAQIADYSVGRRTTDGAWDLCRPTFGAPNVVAAQGPITAIKINEWLADAVVLFPNDFIELINTSSQPVNIGNGYLTDNPVEWPTRHQIRQLTFVAPGGYVSFKADNDVEQGPDHLAFKLSPVQGEIGFFDAGQRLIDNIVYGPQSSDVSQGRTPNGGPVIASFNQPTPGAPNPGLTGTTTTVTNLIPINQAWRYRSSGTDHSTDFIPINFNDSAWVSGGQLLYIEPDPLTSPSGFVKTTALPVDTTNQNRPYNATYFRTHFNYSGSLSNVTLRATIMLDDGAVIYLNGQEATRVRIPSGPVTFATIADANILNASEEVITIPSTALVVGDNVIAVDVHQQHAPGTQSSTDIVFGMKLDAQFSTTTGGGALVLNEVLPINASFQNADGSFAGWIELFNPTTAAIDAADMSLTNDVADPRKFVLPSVSVPAGGYLVVTCNEQAPASATNTGFGLSGAGGAVYLFHKLAVGGGLNDSVNYGTQLSDFSLARIPNGTGPFALALPTPAALNTAAGLGNISGVKINEWYADLSSGWLELYNTGALPVLLSGNYLTDQLNDKTKYLIPPLSFIGGTGSTRWLQLIADNSAGAAAGHVNFTINPAGEALGIFSGNGVQLEAVTFGPQTFGASQGRLPDGLGSIVDLIPTPAAANQPALPDNDRDGMPNDWELAYALNPNDPSDAIRDDDGDGQSNRFEYLAGTDPHNIASNFTATVSAIAGQTHIQFTAQVNKAYTVQYKNALTEAAWRRLTDVAAQGAVHPVDFIDTTGGASQRFYRVVTPQQP